MVKRSTTGEDLADLKEIIGQLFAEAEGSCLAVDKIWPRTAEDDCTTVDIVLHIGGVRVALLETIADHPIPQVICRDTDHEWPRSGGPFWRSMMEEVLGMAKNYSD